MTSGTKDCKNLLVLGSTGSIGRNTLNVAENLGDRVRVVGLAANKNWKLLAEQAHRFRPDYVIIADDSAVEPLKAELHDSSIQVHFGMEAMEEAAGDPGVDIVMCSVVGSVGLGLAVAAAEAGKLIALANKEALVMAGGILRDICERTGARILPVDSEHSAIFQAMRTGEAKEVRRVIVTASGGPFRNMPAADMEHVTPEEALAHPTWNMGRKITVDSATMMNKALEVIEARWLFDLPPEAIEVLIHPESIVHSLVEFRDGSVIAQMSLPDMRLPIQYALTYPFRLNGCIEPLDLASIGSLTFERPDEERFPALRLGFWAAREGGTLGAVLNAANEVAVDLFFQGQIKFTQIAEITEKTMRTHRFVKNPSLEEIREADEWARKEALACCCCPQ